MRRLQKSAKIWFSGAFRHSLSSLYRTEVREPRTNDKSTEDLLTFIRKGSTFNNVDPEKEREPAPEATAVTFPDHKGVPTHDWTEENAPDFSIVYSKIIRPVDISDKHLEALNVRISDPCSLDDLLPLTPEGTSYLPSSESQPTNTGGSYADATKVDGAAARNQRDYENRINELKVANDDGYRVITRSSKPGASAPRLAHMRKFWEGLESISQYWDCSLDEYYEVDVKPQADTSDVSSAKRAKLDESTETTAADQPPEMSSPDARRTWEDLDNCDPDLLSSADRKDLLERVARAKEKDNGAKTNQDGTNSGEVGTSSLRYKGRRIGTGRNMPDQFFVNTVKGFVEGIAWAFQCSVAAPKRMPIVQFGRLNQPVRQTAAVCRMPQDRKKARSGCLEGPIMGLQIRSETDFVDEQGQLIEDKSRMDLLRELGGLLQIAQERRREGKTEAIPGVGKWYTTKPRWGGGPGGLTGKESGENDSANVDAAQETIEAAKKAVERERNGGRSKSRKTPSMLWKEVKPGSGFWDPKTDYQAIGKDPNSAYDEVFLVSALNHHLRILKLTVHNDYTDYTTTGTLPSPLPVDHDWCRPKLQRTQWFDLFDVEQRVDAFRALWAIMRYLLQEMRAPEAQARGDAMDVTKEGGGA